MKAYFDAFDPQVDMTLEGQRENVAAVAVVVDMWSTAEGSLQGLERSILPLAAGVVDVGREC